LYLITTLLHYAMVD